ncbi:MAG: hypothetical protein HUU50_03135 [Candidatus Brocadiae bacterium]|nr:hypothetical protein [Candidatus Brocadiia bacterium]
MKNKYQKPEAHNLTTVSFAEGACTSGNYQPNQCTPFGISNGTTCSTGNGVGTPGTNCNTGTLAITCATGDGAA